MEGLFKVKPNDNVATALAPLVGGREYPLYEEGKGQIGSLVVLRDTPQYKKVALVDFLPGNTLIKFGYPISKVCLSVPKGMLMALSTMSFVESAVGIYVQVPFGVMGTARNKLNAGVVIHVGDVLIKDEVKPYLTEFFDLENPKTTLGEATASVGRGSSVHIGNIVAIDGKERGEGAKRTIGSFYNLMKQSLFLEQLEVKGAPDGH